MIDILNVDFSEMENFHIDDVSQVDLLNIIKIDKSNFGRYDLLILNTYGYSYKENLNQILKIILSFNNLADITDISIGTIIKLPDLNSLFENIDTIDILNTDIVPGVNTVNQKNFNASNTPQQKAKNNQIVALPKLNIVLEKVKYDSDSGIITY